MAIRGSDRPGPHFGFDRIEREQSPQALSLLYKIIDKRNSPRRSTALVTNVDFDRWNEYLGDAILVMALLDRLMERAIKLKIVGAKSYRVHMAPGGSRKTSAKKRSEPAHDKL